MRKRRNQKKCLIDRSICLIGIKNHRYALLQDLCVINYSVSLINQVYVFGTAINGMNAIWVFTGTFPKLHPNPTKGGNRILQDWELESSLTKKKSQNWKWSKYE